MRQTDVTYNKIRYMKKYLIALAMAASTLCGNAVSAQPSAVAQHVKVSVTQAGDTTGIEAYSDTTAADSDFVPQQATYSVNMDSDSFDSALRDMIESSTDLFGVFSILLLLFVLAPAVILGLLFYFIYKIRKQKVRLAEMAMEKGQPIPGGIVREGLEPAEQVWRNGIKNVSIGLGLCCLFGIMNYELCIGLAILLTFYGVGQMVIARTSASKKGRDCSDGDMNSTQDN